MRRTRFDTWPCPIARATDLVGDWWTPLVLRELFSGRSRFDDIQESLGCSRAVLSQRLNRLVDEGLLVKVPYEEHPPRVDYRLTDKGRAFFPHVMVLLDWGDRWFRAPEGPATLLTHTTCGGDFRPVLHCSACARELHGSQIQVGGDPPKSSS